MPEPTAGTQNARLLAHLREGQSINPLRAWALLGIYRLGARVFDLKAMGHPIISERKVVRNRFGEEITVANYKLEKAK